MFSFLSIWNGRAERVSVYDHSHGSKVASKLETWYGHERWYERVFALLISVMGARFLLNDYDSLPSYDGQGQGHGRLFIQNILWWLTCPDGFHFLPGRAQSARQEMSGLRSSNTIWRKCVSPRRSLNFLTDLDIAEGVNARSTPTIFFLFFIVCRCCTMRCRGSLGVPRRAAKHDAQNAPACLHGPFRSRGIHKPDDLPVEHVAGFSYDGSSRPHGKRRWPGETVFNS